MGVCFCKNMQNKMINVKNMQENGRGGAFVLHKYARKVHKYAVFLPESVLKNVRRKERQCLAADGVVTRITV